MTNALSIHFTNVLVELCYKSAQILYDFTQLRSRRFRHLTIAAHVPRFQLLNRNIDGAQRDMNRMQGVNRRSLPAYALALQHAHEF